jgi:hypothetical protein
VRRRQIELLILGTLIIGVIAYAGTGIVYSGAQVADAERTLNAVVSHQNSLTTSFNEIHSEVAALNGGSTFNSQQALALVDKSVADAQAAIQTINQDDASLRSIERQLDGGRWLTAVGRSSVDRESARIGHARNALSAAKAIKTDEVLDGTFWHSLYSALAELDMVNTQNSTGDYVSARSTLTTMKDDVDHALQQSTSPGLPADLHNLMSDMQTFVSDYGHQLDAQLAGDAASVAADQASLDTDRTKISSYDIDKIGTEIDAFYEPLIDRFNSEMSAATS